MSNNSEQDGGILGAFECESVTDPLLADRIVLCFVGHLVYWHARFVQRSDSVVDLFIYPRNFVG